DNLLHGASLQIKGIYNMPTSLDLAKVLNKELELFEPLARDKEIEIDKLFNADSAIFVFIDPNMISFIIRNLLSNAIKFTPSGGKIDVEIIKSTGYTAVSVRDTGTGIPEHLISDIFRYGGASKTKGTNNEEGAGLGLSLCREFILQSKGTIDVVSVEGKGSTFTFVIPTAPN
ncbi:MAG: HAMP domain-containing histidine kinase, partial [Cyclobacteriaceae bacterium]|nr:HAMP domain-containing histidine kinase [Cyclobacteriaceae bacterium]